ncbi:MAG: hypothetical protein C4575_13040 [Desulforudis sp.]|jgi:low affinity Fe/Cu permease|nr:MAG: hypothetical protein C4575_13040 [Desulforudis sp.]
MNIFDRINTAIESAEGSIITLVTMLIPWLAPALPAWLTWYHLTGVLQIPAGISAAMALTVEFLGLSAVSTAFSYMRHNKLNRAQKNRVSLAFPIGAYLFYLLVVVTVNVVQEIPMSEKGQQISRVVSIALLTLISAPAFVIAIARDQQRKIEAEISGMKTEKFGKKPEASVKISDWRKLPEEDRQLIANMTTREIMQAYGVIDRTARNWRSAARNGHAGNDSAYS